MNATPKTQLRPWEAVMQLAPELTETEMSVLGRIAGHVHPALQPAARAALGRLAAPIEETTGGWCVDRSKQARNYILKESYRRQLAFWAWDEATWLDIIATGPAVVKWARFQIVALGYLFGGHRRLHARAGIFRLGQFADLVFGPSAVRPALDEVLATLRSWKASERTLPSQVTHATVDLLLSCGSPHLADVSYQTLLDVVAEHRQGRTSGRRNGLTKLSRVLAHGGSSRRR